MTQQCDSTRLLRHRHMPGALIKRCKRLQQQTASLPLLTLLLREQQHQLPAPPAALQKEGTAPSCRAVYGTICSAAATQMSAHMTTLRAAPLPHW